MKDREAPINQNDNRVVLLGELIESLAALGSYLIVIQRELENRPELKQGVIEEAMRKGLSQYERASEATRRLQAQPP